MRTRQPWVTAAMWLAFSAVISSTPLNGQIPQDDIRRDITKAFEQQKFPVGVWARDDRIVLEGRVRNVFVNTKALQIALSQPGVDEVESEIEGAKVVLRGVGG